MKKMKDNKIFFRVVDPYFNKQHLSYKKKFINFQKIKTKFDLILIAVAHDYFKNIGLNRIKKKLNKNGKIFDLKSLFNKNYTNFRL